MNLLCAMDVPRRCNYRPIARAQVVFDERKANTSIRASDKNRFHLPKI